MRSPLRHRPIIEKRLGIQGDYQFKAIRSKNYLQSNWHRNKLFVVQRLIRFDKNFALLDLGTGSGNLELELAAKVKKIVGIDYNDEALNFLRRQLLQRHIKNVALFQSDIRDLKIIKGLARFDYIIIIDTIEHVSMKDGQKLIATLKRYLKNQGKIVIITPNYHSSWFFIELLLDKVTIVPKFANHQHLAKYTRQNLGNLFTDLGYKIELLSSFNGISYLIPNAWLSQRIAHLETRIPLSVGNLLIGIFSNSKI